MKQSEMLDLLAGMSDDWSTHTAALLDLAVATVMVQEGLSQVAISPAEVRTVLRDYDITREVVSRLGTDFWVVNITPKVVP